MKNHEVKKRKSNEKLRRIILGSVGLLCLILAIAYLCLSQYYKDHFYARTYINGMDCSNLTAEEAKELITTNVNTYVLAITARDGSTQKIGANDIELSCTFDKDFQTVLENQSPYAWFTNAFKRNVEENSYTLHYDKKKLNSMIDKLECLEASRQIAPTNATISAYSEENGFTIVNEEQGNKLIKDKVSSAIKDAINELQGSLSLESADCYEKPTVNRDAKILQTALDTMNQYLKTKLTYTFGEKIEVLDASKVGPTLKVDDEYNVIVDEAKVKEFVDYIGRTYNTIFTNRTFMTSYGKEITTDGGDYGWWLNRNEELKQIVECIKNAEVKDKEPVYYQTAVQYGADDLGKTYVEINLATQHLFVYKDGKKVVESDFVSGNVSKGHGTKTGVYPIKYKEEDTFLKGANGDGTNYNTHVDYWMPFNGGVGLHDAGWRHGRFGGTIYKNAGSHGCINLPPANAKLVFEAVSKGTPVIVYDMPIS